MTEEEYRNPWLLVTRLSLFICAPVGRLDEWMVRQNIGKPYFAKTPEAAVLKAAKDLDDPAHDL